MEAASRPPRLLAPVCIDGHRQLFRYHQVLDVCGLPASELGAIAELQVLGERGSAPSAGVVDGLTPPNSRRAGEVGEEAFVRAHGLLDEKVEVDGQRLQAREPRVALVEVPPPRLRETDLRVVEDAKDAAEEVAGRHEVGVEDGDERCGGEVQSVLERAGLEVFTRTAPDVGDPCPLSPPVRCPAADDETGLVIRVVEQLHLEAVTRPLHRAHRVDDALGDVALVVDGDLHADSWFFAGLNVRRNRGADARGAPGEVEKIQSEAEQSEARRREHPDRDRGDHVGWVSSNNV